MVYLKVWNTKYGKGYEATLKWDRREECWMFSISKPASFDNSFEESIGRYEFGPRDFEKAVERTEKSWGYLLKGEYNVER